MFIHLHLETKIALLELSGTENNTLPVRYLFIQSCMSLARESFCYVLLVRDFANSIFSGKLNGNQRKSDNFRNADSSLNFVHLR